jgi:L-ascorbate metabolism protein UlaG (beta-lactamase superfamily)
MDMKSIFLFSLIITSLAASAFGQDMNRPKSDEFTYGKNKLTIRFLGHATLMLDFNGTIIHVDPTAAYLKGVDAPKADIILITHEHGDHLDPGQIAKLSRDDTQIVANPAVAGKLKKGLVMKNGEKREVKGIPIEAVPAYNTTKGHEGFHPKGRDNGYILTLGTKRVYIAGDTEDIPEMAALKNIDIAFLPVNQPYSMTPAQAARAAAMFTPKILYPYHFSSTDPAAIETALKQVKGVEVRLRDMQ